MDDLPENDALWQTLGRAKPVSASPYFVRKVLREARSLRQAPSQFQILLRWLIPAGAAAALAVGVLSWQNHQQDVSTFNAYFDAAAGLEALVAIEDASAWVAVN